MESRRPEQKRPFFWGKAKILQETGEVLEVLPLVDHCLDVAIVFRKLLDIPLFKSRLERAASAALEDTHFDRLSSIVALHDIGKANLGFQHKIYDPNAPSIGHINELVAFFERPELSEKLAQSLDSEMIASWFTPPHAVESLLIACWSHHGRPVYFDGIVSKGAERWWKPGLDTNPFDEIKHIIEKVQETFPYAFRPDVSPITISPALQHRFAGLVMLADWIGSHPAYFPLQRSQLFDREETAIKVLQEIGLDSKRYQEFAAGMPTDFITRFGFNPRSLQAVSSTLSVEHEHSNLLLFESDTGSGKTEAALDWFFSLFAAGKVGGLYFALPTRVAARELYIRIQEYVRKLFPDTDLRPNVLLAVPGYVKVDNIPLYRILPGDHDTGMQNEGESFVSGTWAAEHPKRFLAATIAVGTIDQALLSVIQVKHAHLRSVCLDRNLLVIDEVHASDPYMRKLVTSLVDHHIGMGGYALLLSATLGATARAQFTQTSLEPLTIACKAPYPAITDRTGSMQTVPKLNNEHEKNVYITTEPFLCQPELLIPRLVQMLSEDARILFIFNTVNRAITFQKALESNQELSHDWLFHCKQVICPHHGRFSPVDREILDTAVSRRFGKDSSGGPVILVGTQTLEQSLDIDADLLITDLCPMDVLLQRIGRLHRHSRTRPSGYEHAQCMVLIPELDDFYELLNTQGTASRQSMAAGLGSVYPDMRTLQLTRNMLFEKPVITIPQDNRFLVERASHPDALKELQGERWEAHGKQIEGNHLAQQVQAHYALLTKLYEKSFGEFTFHEPTDAYIRTRLGLDTLRIEVDRPVLTPFGTILTEILIPRHLAPNEIPDQQVVVTNTRQEKIEMIFGNRSYQYSRFGLEALHV